MNSNYTESFPQLQELEKQGISYLDSAATTLKLGKSLERQYQFDRNEVANVHRGAHRLSSEATFKYENSRTKMAEYLNVSSEQIAFTKGTTESANLLAFNLEREVQSGDCILLTEMEHHANLLPWQRLAQNTGAQLLFLNVDQNGEISLEEAEELFKAHPIKIISFCHISNTLGTVNPARELISLAKKYGALSCVDGAQASSCLSLDLKALDPDFYYFSAHKCFGPFGLGILYIKAPEKLSPYQVGGAIVDQVDFKTSSFLTSIHKLESGTPNISAVVALSPAIDFLSSLDFKELAEKEAQLLEQARIALNKIDGFKEFGTSKSKINILSFYFEGLHSNDLAELLDEQGVALRAGHHCTQPLLKKFSLNSCLRASFSIYNDKEDVEKLVEGCQKALRILR